MIVCTNCGETMEADNPEDINEGICDQCYKEIGHALDRTISTVFKCAGCFKQFPVETDVGGVLEKSGKPVCTDCADRYTEGG